MVDVFEYTDFRKFLKDRQEATFAANRAFSFRYYSEKAGINSSSFYQQIIKGKRNLTKNTILKTCIAFSLNTKEAEYFENLVFFNQTKSIDEKNLYFEKLMGMQKLRGVKKVQDAQYDYFSAWYHPIIREVVTFFPFNDDYALLGKQLNPAISEKQAKESITLLLSLGFIHKEGELYRQSEPLLQNDSDREFKIHQVTNYQIQTLKLAIEAYDRWNPQHRLTSATSFSISDKNYDAFVQILRDCRSRLMNITMDDENPERVYMLNMNLYPVSRKGKKGGSHA